MVMDGGATASRIMGEQEAEMREQMVAAARVMTTLAGGSVLNIGQAMADFVGTPPNPLRVHLKSLLRGTELSEHKAD